MPLPKQLGVYNDCYEVWAAAVATPGGCRTLIGTYSQAEYFRARMHQARSLLRAQSRRSYDKTHPAYDTSEYDNYKTTLKEDDDGDYWIYVEHHGNWNAVANIEPIPINERPAQPPTIIEHQSQLLLSATPKDIDHAEQDDLE